MVKEVIEAFEEKYGNLQSEYDVWRSKNEELKRNGEKSGVWTMDCSFAEARESFSEHCGLSEVIPFDVMYQYEQSYPE